MVSLLGHCESTISDGFIELGTGGEIEEEDE
jgi:hypothetical protein